MLHRLGTSMPIDDDLSLPNDRLAIGWYRRMQHALDNEMSPDEVAEFERWEAEHVKGDGEFTSTDWPGWARIIGPPPWEYGKN